MDEKVRPLPTRQRRFTREKLAEIEPLDMEYLVKGLLPRRGLGFIVGPSATWKTFLALEVAFRVSRGEAVCGHRTKRAGVAYVAAEDANGVRARVKALRLRNGAEGAFELIPQAPNLRDMSDRAMFRSVLSELAVDFEVAGTPLGLVVLDTLSKISPGADQNSSMDMGQLIADLAQIAVDYDCLVLVIAHSPKDETKGISGWHGQFAGADAVLALAGEKEDGLRIVSSTKQKNGPEGGRMAFRLEVVEIGLDQDGEPFTSCVVAFDDPPAKAAVKKAPRLGAPEQIALNALNAAIDSGDPLPAPPLEGVLPGTKAARKDDVRQRAFTGGFTKEDEARGTRNKRWDRTLEKLVAANVVRIHEDLLWPIR